MQDASNPTGGDYSWNSALCRALDILNDFMANSVDHLGIYLHLARASDQRRRPMVRDRLLIMAGAIAAEMHLDTVAAYCRHQVLQHNPRHLVRRWPTLSAALDDEDFKSHRAQLKRRYPREKAEQMLDSLGIQLANERDTYFSDFEYAAAIMGTTPDALDEQFGELG